MDFSANLYTAVKDNPDKDCTCLHIARKELKLFAFYGQPN